MEEAETSGAGDAERAGDTERAGGAERAGEAAEVPTEAPAEPVAENTAAAEAAEPRPAGPDGPVPTETPAAAASPRRRWKRLVLAGVVLLLAALGLLARDVLRIRNDLNSGQTLLGHLQLTSLDSRTTIDATIGKAHRNLDNGADLTRDSIWLKALAHVPKIGPQVRAARVLSRSAAQVGDIVYAAALNARSQLDAPRSGPAARLHLIDTLRQDLIVVNGQIRQVPTTTHGRLLHTLAKAEDKLVTKLASAKTELTDGIQLTATLRTMLAGPRTYLVLAGNNAEMRSGGITTAAGLIHFQGGDLTTSAFVSSFDLLLPPDKAVTVPPELKQLYGFLTPGQEWRTTNTSPNWPVVAQMYANMSANSPFGKVDGVLFVDVLTLRSVLSVIGPVTVNGVKYNAANVVPQVLYTNYLLYPTADQTNARRDVQSSIARAAFSALRGGSYSLPTLAKELQSDAKGRHLLAWSSVASEEAMWTKLGADGSIGPNDFMVSVQNLSGSKLDLFIEPIVTISSQRFSDHQQVDVTLTLTNPRRGKTSAYIEGGFPCCVLPGDQRVFVLYYLPGSAYNIVSHRPSFGASGTDGGMTVVGMVYIVPYAQTSTVHITFFLPLSQNSVTLIPTSRVRPEQILVNGVHATTDAMPNKVAI